MRPQIRAAGIVPTKWNERMRGRQVFSLVQPALVAATRILMLLPRPACRGLLVFARSIPFWFGLGLRYVLVRRLARSCGRSVAIFENVYLRRLENASFGDHVSIHPMCYLDAIGGLTIGCDVSIAHGTSIVTFEHNFSDADRPTREQLCTPKPVAIGNDVWIGAGARILGGVTIGDRVVIGAGAVVTRDVPSGSLAVGVPARIARRIKEEPSGREAHAVL